MRGLHSLLIVFSCLAATCPTLRHLSLSLCPLCFVMMTVMNMVGAELFDAGKEGRGLRAAKELNTGEVVFTEPSFSAVVFDRYKAFPLNF